ncbi:WD40-repeat-containing domain protein, partial [Mycena epipterygia]
PVAAAPNSEKPGRETPSFLNDLDLTRIHPKLKKEGSDWFVVYNPKLKRTLDINLMHTFVHETVVCCNQFSGDGKYLATGCDQTAQIYDVQTGQKICVLAHEASEALYIQSVCFSPDRRYLATGTGDEHIWIWDIKKRTIHVIFEGHHRDIYSLEFSLNGQRLVSGSGDASVRIWDMDNYAAIRVLTATPESDAPDNDAGVASIAILPDGALIAAGCLDALVHVWAAGTGVLVEVLRGHENSVYSVVFTRDGGGVVSGALDNTICVWDLRAKTKKEGVPCTVFAGHKDYVLSVDIARDAQWIVSRSKDRGVHFWDSNGIVQCLLKGHKNSVIWTSFHSVRNLLATCSGDKLARICTSSPFLQFPWLMAAQGATAFYELTRRPQY